MKTVKIMKTIEIMRTVEIMKTKAFMAMAALALVAAACNNDDEITDNWNGEIRLSSGLEAQQTGTRSISTDLQGIQIAANNHVGFFINENVASDATTTYTQNLDYTANGSGGFSGTTVYFPQSGNGVNIYAYAPWKTGLALNGSYAFTVAADQSSNDNYIASDLLWGQPMKEDPENGGSYITANPVARTKENVPVSFSHLLSKIEVELIAGNGLNADNFKGATLYILNTKPGTSLTLSSGVISGASDASGEGASAYNDGIIAAKYGTDQTPTLTAAAIVVPQTVTKGTKFMKLHLATGGDLYYTLPDGDSAQNLTLESGKIYKYKITVNLTGLTVTSSITAWKTIGDGNPITGTATME